MKNLIILILLISSPLAYAEKIDMPASISLAEELPVDSEALGFDVHIRGLMLSANITFHKALFMLDDHPCNETKDCDQWTDYVVLQNKANYFGSKVIVASVAMGVLAPANRKIRKIFEAFTKDGARNVLKMGALSVGAGLGFLYWNDYVEALRTLSDEEQDAVVQRLELAQLAIERVDYSVTTNIIGTLGIGQIFGFNTVEDMIADMEELNAIIEGQ